MEYESKNFKAKEFRCKCPKCNMQKPHQMKPEVIDALQRIRDKVGPLVITSAYRCKDHPIEAKKSTPGQHNKGVAVDVKFSGSVQRFQILKEAFSEGASGIGWDKSFIHIDWRKGSPSVAWDY